MLPGQLYLRQFNDQPFSHPKGKSKNWIILLITKVSRPATLYHRVTGLRRKMRGYRMVTYEVIAKTKGFWCLTSHDMSSDSVAAIMECKRLARKDLPLYLDGDVTKKFEELLKRA